MVKERRAAITSVDRSAVVVPLRIRAPPVPPMRLGAVDVQAGLRSVGVVETEGAVGERQAIVHRGLMIAVLVKVRFVASVTLLRKLFELKVNTAPLAGWLRVPFLMPPPLINTSELPTPFKARMLPVLSRVPEIWIVPPVALKVPSPAVVNVPPMNQGSAVGGLQGSGVGQVPELMVSGSAGGLGGDKVP